MTDNTKKTTSKILFQINSSSYRGEPFELGSDKNKYLSYFQNEDGDKWIFGVDSENRAFLTGSDVGWDISYLGGGIRLVSDIILSEEERMWLVACWAATALIREDAEVEVPSEVMTFPMAAGLWQLSETTLKRDSTPSETDSPKLKANKIGGVWLVTARAMVAAYGMPDGYPGEYVKMLIEMSNKDARKKPKTRRHPF